MTNTAKAMSMTAPDLASEEQKGLICSILADFAADPDVEVLFAYLCHCGFPLRALRSAHDILPAFLALYRIRPGHYDVDRACRHLATWPPIAARIAALQAEAKARAEAAACLQTGNLPDDL